MFKNTSSKSLLIFLIRFLTAINFGFIYSSLTLYLTNVIHFSLMHAVNITSLFIALYYFFPIIAGYIGNNFIDFKSLFLLGLLFQIISSVLWLLAASKTSAYFAVSFFVAGSMVITLCINMLLTKIHDRKPAEIKREAFIWLYFAMNFGILFGYLLSGFFTIFHDYSALFILNALINTFIIFTVILLFKGIRFNDKYRAKSAFPVGFTLYLLVILISYFILQSHALSRNYLLLIYTLSFLLIAKKLLFSPADFASKKHCMSVLIILLLSIVFWAIYMITPTILMAFLQTLIKHRRWHHTIAPQWIGNIDPIVALIFSPIVINVMKRKKGLLLRFKDSTFCFAFGIFLTILALWILVLSLQYHLVLIFSIMLFIFMTSLAEIFVGPVSYAFIVELLPDSLKGLVSGFWVITIGFGGLISGYLSKSIFNIREARANHLPYPMSTNINVSVLLTVTFMVFLVTYCLLRYSKRLTILE